MAMTGDQYDALVKLMRGDPASAGNRAARRVLVDGITQAEAMRETGSTRAAISNAVRRYTDAGRLMQDVFGVKKE